MNLGQPGHLYLLYKEDPGRMTIKYPYLLLYYKYLSAPQFQSVVACEFNVWGGKVISFWSYHLSHSDFIYFAQLTALCIGR